jgi:hypothetical protein
LLLIGWDEIPTKSKTLVYPIKEADFPTVTFCTKNNNPDRWGAAIKILDHLDLTCEEERYRFITSRSGLKQNIFEKLPIIFR